MGSGSQPSVCQSAVPVATSSRRRWCPYQATTCRCQVVWPAASVVASRRSHSLGWRGPFFGLTPGVLAGRTRWRIVQLGVEHQTGDQPHASGAADVGEPQDREAAVPDHLDGPVGLPAADEADQHLGPLRRRPVRLPQLGADRRGEGRDRQERQGPAAPAPGDGDQQHHADPVDPVARDHVPRLGPGRVVEAPLPGDLPPATALQRPVHDQLEGRVRRQEGAHEQVQQQPAEHQGRPDAAIEHPMVGGEPALLAQPHGTQGGRHRPPPAGEDRPGHQDQHVAERRRGERDRKRRQQRQRRYDGERWGRHGAHLHLDDDITHRASVRAPSRAPPQKGQSRVSFRARVEMHGRTETLGCETGTGKNDFICYSPLRGAGSGPAGASIHRLHRVVRTDATLRTRRAPAARAAAAQPRSDGRPPSPCRQCRPAGRRRRARSRSRRAGRDGCPGVAEGGACVAGRRAEGAGGRDAGVAPEEGGVPGVQQDGLRTEEAGPARAPLLRSRKTVDFLYGLAPMVRSRSRPPASPAGRLRPSPRWPA